MPFVFADFNLYSLAVINCNCVYNSLPELPNHPARGWFWVPEKNANNTSWKPWSGEFLKKHTWLRIKHVRCLYLLDKNELSEGRYQELSVNSFTSLSFYSFQTCSTLEISQDPTIKYDCKVHAEKEEWFYLGKSSKVVSLF